MGQEAACIAHYKGQQSRRKAWLETDELVFRGTFRLAIPYRQIRKAEAAGDDLHVAFETEDATFTLGAAAEKWAARINSPKSRLQKLGIKPGMRVVVLGLNDADFVDELRAGGAAVSARPGKNVDAVFFHARTSNDLERLASLRQGLKPAGALWVVREKGRKDVSEAAVMAAGKRAGVVDVKVVKFSDTLTAEKFVIRVRDRNR